MCFKTFVITFMRIKSTYAKIELHKYLAMDIGDFNMK